MTTTKKLKLVPFDKDGSLIASTFAAKLMESRGLPVYWRSPSPFLARLTFIPTNILSDGKRRFMISSHELMKLIPMMEKGTVSGKFRPYKAGNSFRLRLVPSSPIEQLAAQAEECDNVQ